MGVSWLFCFFENSSSKIALGQKKTCHSCGRDLLPNMLNISLLFNILFHYFCVKLIRGRGYAWMCDVTTRLQSREAHHIWHSSWKPACVKAFNCSKVKDEMKKVKSVWCYLMINGCSIATTATPTCFLLAHVTKTHPATTHKFTELALVQNESKHYQK